MAVSQAEAVDVQSRTFRSLTMILTLGVMARFPPPGCLDLSKSAIGRGLAPALNHPGSHGPNQVSSIVVTRQCLGSSERRERQRLEQTARPWEDGTGESAKDSPEKSNMESSPVRNADEVRDQVAEVCASLGARAAGYWQLDQETARLVQLVFVPGVGLDPEVGRKFAAATGTVPLSQTGLGIVAAALTGQPAVSRVADLPADSGSGRWLRAFGASRSVAVPIRGEGGKIQGVFSVALAADSTVGDRIVAERICGALVPRNDWTLP